MEKGKLSGSSSVLNEISVRIELWNKAEAFLSLSHTIQLDVQLVVVEVTKSEQAAEFIN